MAIHTPEFNLKIKSTYDAEGIENAKAGLADIQGQLKSLENDIAAAQRSGVSVPQEAMDQVANLKHVIAGYGEEVGKSELKTHELKEALHVLGDAAGNALGPIGQLAHFLGNPYILAAFGAVAAIKMLVEQHQQLLETTQKNVTASREMHESFANNLTTAFHTVTAAVAQFHATLAATGREQNEFAARLTEQTSLIHEQAAAYTALANARQQYYDANIQGAEASGQMSGPEAHFAEEHARQQARAQAEAAESAAHAREVAEQRKAATDAKTASDAAAHEVDSRTDQRIGLQAAASDLQDEIDRRKKTESETGAEVDKASANALVTGARPTAQEAASVPDLLSAARAAHVGGATGMITGEAEAMDIQKRVEAWKAFDEAAKRHTDAVDEVKTSVERLAEAKIKQTDFEADTARLAARAETLKTFAEDTNRAADAAERLNHATEGAHAPIDATQDQTEQVRRRNYLADRVRTGTATNDEVAEAQGAGSQTPGADIAGILRQFGDIARHAHAYEGGHVSAQEAQQLKQLADRIVGLMESMHITTLQHDSVLPRLMGRVQSLEQSQSNLASSSTYNAYQ